MHMTNTKELEKLVHINQDACEFYMSAQDKTENPQLKMTFRNLESLHKGIAINLKHHIRTCGGTVEDDETLHGKAQKFWADLMANISNDVDETLVEHLEEAEDRCLYSMKKVINKNDMTADTRILLDNELQTLQKSHDYMKALKECMKAA